MAVHLNLNDERYSDAAVTGQELIRPVLELLGWASTARDLAPRRTTRP